MIKKFASSTPGKDPVKGDPVDSAVGRFYQRYLRDIEITFPQFLIVTALADGQPRTVKQIAALLEIRPHTVRSILLQLVAVRMVRRQRQEMGDRRIFLISLAPDASALAQQLLGIQAKVDLQFGLVGEELDRLRKTLLCLARDRRRAASNPSDPEQTNDR